MHRTLDLILTIFKCFFWLTIVRLVSSAFNWEFGVSRQYLRLLEWIFKLGQERIKRAESRDSQRALGFCRNNNDEKDELDCGQVRAQISRPAELDLAMLERQIEHRNGSDENGNKLEPLVQDGRMHWSEQQQKSNGHKLATANWTRKGDASVNVVASKQRMRRVLTPDGPPVFLLDDLDLGDANDELDLTEEHLIEGCCQHEFHMEDAALFVVRGVAAIIDDQVTKRFTPEQLKTWNLLTRTNAKNYQFMSRSLGLCWLTGLIIRYFILLPLRIMFTIVGFIWLTFSMVLIGMLPSKIRDLPYTLTTLMAFRLLACGITSKLKFHNRQFMAQKGDICVANHTSPLDVIVMGCDNSYALVGQKHGGLLGLLEFALSRAANHVWFDRSEMRDRQLVSRRIKQHISHKSNLPVLIFPEGTCINNSAVMLFRKGSFEVTDKICPVAIKYDPRFGDPFWNSSKQSYIQYLLMMMSSWAIKCDVWYLPPMTRTNGESSLEFANRVKAEIARQGGLVDLAWDGQLKRSSIKPTWLYQQQEDYAKRLKLE